jgi:hypothetical protein
MIGAGSFAARAVGPMAYIKSPDKGTPGVEVTVELKAGPNTGERIQWVGWLTDRTLSRTTEALSYMGWDGSDPETVTRQEFVAVVEHEEYTAASGETRTRARVAWINDATGGGRLTPMTNTEVAGAQERLRAAFAALKVKSAVVAKADDDVRF